MLLYLRNVALGILLGLLFGCALGKVQARDMGQWDNDDYRTRWFRSLQQPDNPSVSCCGEADAYWCDDFYVRDGVSYCKITDDRPDLPLSRHHVPVGTEIEIPDNKLMNAEQIHGTNPTGHAIVFLNGANYVWCYVMAGGA